ncbi:VgrG-related protein [Streptomyces botrytidirepellens]|uniref:Type IV secretion protein Rhs n=1 Tax=Streptomyces botrytidirepellens TaxID=2486417 RepID=A0A3M8U1N8_9ACTN|nr:VgrG-related protein [Streptomyces botrytidirepellens]RNF98356.1 type IV secretion protein Rhs [Streptomyces botrytidirepellens]
MPPISYSSIIHVTLDGTPLHPTEVAPLLAEAWVDFGAGVPGAFQLTFRDPKRTVLGLAKITIGTKVVLAPVASGKGAQDPLFTGEVTGLETDYDSTGWFTVVRGYDLGHRMLRQRRVAGYTAMRASDIAKRLIGKSGVTVGRIEPTKTTYEFITQDNVTDWDFLARLAEENKKVMFLDARGEFQFVSRKNASGAPPPSTDGDKSPFVLHGGVDVLRCRASVTSADQVPQVQARGWNVQAKKAITAQAPTTSNPALANGTKPGAGTAKFKATKLVDASFPYDQQGEVGRAAQALADDVTSAFAELEVTVHGNPKLRADIPVTLRDVGKPFDGKYTMTGVRHVFEMSRPYTTLVTVSGRQWRSLYGLASGGEAAAPRMPSVANAIVTNVKDPLKQGRVKLKFPWLDPDYVSDWTRTVQSAGVGGGSIFPLDVNDEVLVAFDRGALDHPYVIGGLYNGKDKPKPGDVPLHDALKGKATRHTVADRENNRLDLLSQKIGKRGVRLSTGNDRLTINLDRTKTEISVDSKGTVVIKGTGAVSVQAGGNLSLRAGGTMNLNAGGALNITAGGALSATAGAAFNIKGGSGSIQTGALSVTAGAVNVLPATFTMMTPGAITVGGTSVALTGLVTINSHIPVVV